MSKRVFLNVQNGVTNGAVVLLHGEANPGAGLVEIDPDGFEHRMADLHVLSVDGTMRKAAVEVVDGVSRLKLDGQGKPQAADTVGAADYEFLTVKGKLKLDKVKGQKYGGAQSLEEV